MVGGANVIDKIECRKKYGTDINTYLIAIYQNIDKISELPQEITREEYSSVRQSYYDKDGKYPDWYIGAIGFLASYNGKFFGGYAGKVNTKINTIRDYYDEAKRNLLSQVPNLKGIKWKAIDYRLMKRDISGYVIYCDIPYINTTGYQSEFDHDEFWQWAREMSKENVVLVSEQKAPDDWTAIWQQSVKRTLDNNSRFNGEEKLFILSENLNSNTQ